MIKEILWLKPDIIITFDEGGETNYLNYKSLLSAAALLNFVNVYALKMRKRISLITAEEAIVKALMIERKQDVRGIKNVLFVSRPLQ